MESIRIPVDAEVLAELARRLRSPDESFNDLLRRWLGLPPRCPGAATDDSWGDSASEGESGRSPVMESRLESRSDSNRESPRSATRGPASPVPLPDGSELRARHKGREIRGRVRDGAVELAGRRFPSLSAAARHVTGHPVNGWRFFAVRPPGARDWLPADRLRRGGDAAAPAGGSSGAQ